MSAPIICPTCNESGRIYGSSTNHDPDGYRCPTCDGEGTIDVEAERVARQAAEQRANAAEEFEPILVAARAVKRAWETSDPHLTLKVIALNDAIEAYDELG